MVSYLKRLPLADALMLVLALGSLSLLIWDWVGAPTEAQRVLIQRIDIAICAAFACDFVWRWRRAGWTRQYVLHNWYEIIGMIPLQQPALRAFRLVRVVIVISRLGIIGDRLFGDMATHRLMRRFKQSLVDEISGQVTLAVIGEVEQVLYKGTYTRNLARSLSRQHDALRELVMDKLREDTQTGRLSKLPFYNTIVQAVIDAVLRVGSDLLEDPRADQLVADIVRENLQQIRKAVEQREQQREQRYQQAHSASAPPAETTPGDTSLP